MKPVLNPEEMNEAFAEAFNSKSIDRLLSLYEANASLCITPGGDVIHGRQSIAQELSKLLQIPGKMTSRNCFCIRNEEIALLRAEWRLQDGNGLILAEGSSAEIVRMQEDGTWLYLIDHAAGSQ